MTATSGQVARQDVTSRLADVRRSLAAACREAGRDPSSVVLVAASKTVPPEVLETTILAGHQAFGENRVQEAKAKWPALRERYPHVRLALIGPLQSNKVRDAVSIFDVVQSVDRPSLARALAAECARQGRQVDVLVQVNTGAEAQKSGVAVAEVDGLVELCREQLGLSVTGLMCVPPAGQDPMPHFALLAQLAGRHGLAELSMGMSGDFVDAVRAGSTQVRVGSAIFGARPPLVPVGAAAPGEPDSRT
jgi:pyridoxal phosphate enzyme (YggS family)